MLEISLSIFHSLQRMLIFLIDSVSVLTENTRMDSELDFYQGIVRELFIISSKNTGAVFCAHSLQIKL